MINNKLIIITVPFIFIFLSFTTGIYTNKKVSTIYFKCAALFFSSIASAIFIYIFTNSVVISSYWFAFTYFNLILPRLILTTTNKNSPLNYIINLRGPVVVIGGAGYIGSHVVRILMESGKSVRVLDNLMYGDSSISTYKNNPNFEIIVGDTTDIRCLTEVMRGASAVIHLSGLVGDPACAVDKVFTRHQNIIATQLVRDVAQSMGVNRLIFSSSCSVYGVSDIEVSETDKLNPVSLYAETKMDSENELLKSNRDDFLVTILRFATVFGDSKRPRFDLVANLFAAQAFMDKKITIMGPDQWRPFIHVSDLARAIVIVLNAPENKIRSQIFNVGDSRLNMTLGQLGEIVRNVASKNDIDLEIKIIEGNDSDKRNYSVSFKKIKSILNFEASILMEDGIYEIIEKFRKGVYNDYKNGNYSNLLTTKNLVTEFYDPLNRKNLYAPISEN